MRTAGLLATRLDKVDHLLLRGRSEIQTGAAEPADGSREGTKPVVFRGGDDGNELAPGDDRSDSALRDLVDQGREGGAGIGHAAARR